MCNSCNGRNVEGNFRVTVKLVVRWRRRPTRRPPTWVAIPLVSALQLVLGHYDIYDVDDLVAILRSPHAASQVADLIVRRQPEPRADRCDGGQSTRQRADRLRDGDGRHDDGKCGQRA